MIRLPPVLTRTATLLPCASLFRSGVWHLLVAELRVEPTRRGIVEDADECRIGWRRGRIQAGMRLQCGGAERGRKQQWQTADAVVGSFHRFLLEHRNQRPAGPLVGGCGAPVGDAFAACAEIARSEEHTSELQSLMRNSYAVFCLKKKNISFNHILCS